METAEESTASARWCKLCHEGPWPNDPLRSPCACKGSMKYIHESCLSQCVKRKQHCEICLYRYKFKKVFQEGTPEALPCKYLLLSFGSRLSRSLKTYIAVAYFVLRLVITVALNSAIVQHGLFDIRAYGLFAYVVSGFLLLLWNHIHNLVISQVSRALNSGRRVRMNPRRAIHSMASDVLSRVDSELRSGSYQDADSVTSLSASLVNLENSLNDDDEIDQNSSSVSLEESFQTVGDLRDHIFYPVNLKVLLQDVLGLPKFIWVSVVIYCFSVGTEFAYSLWPVVLKRISVPPHVRFETIMFGDPYKSMASVCATVRDFIIASSLDKPIFYWVACCFALVLITAILNMIRKRIRSKAACLAYNCSKLYLLTVLAVFSHFLVIGAIAHYTFAVVINGGMPIFAVKSYWLATLFHIVLGQCLRKCPPEFHEALLSVLRPGLYFNPYTIKSYNQLIDYLAKAQFRHIIAMIIFKIVGYSIILRLIIMHAVAYCRPLAIKDTRTLLICLKLLLMLGTVSKNFTRLCFRVCLLIIVGWAKLFRAENYIFNRGMVLRGEDKSRLVWDVNATIPNASLRTQAARINNVLNAYKDQEGHSETHFAESTSVHSQPRPSETASATSSLRQRRERLSMEDLKWRIMKKYKITDEKIEKYFQRNHNGKFSLFYKPRFYMLFKFLTIISCILAVFAIYHVITEATAYIAQLLFPSYGMFHLISAAITLMQLAYVLFSYRLLEYVKYGMLYLFTNVVWPLIATVVYMVFFSRSARVVFFSETFLCFSILSFVFEFIFSYTTLVLSPHACSFFLLLRKLVLFTIFVSCMLPLCALVREYIRLSALVYMSATIYISCTAFVLIKALVSGNLVSDIKDYYFLKELKVQEYSQAA